MRRLVIKPASCSPRAVSCISSRILLLRVFVAITHLRQFAFQYRDFELFSVKLEKNIGYFLESSQFVLADIRPSFFANPYRNIQRSLILVATIVLAPPHLPCPGRATRFLMMSPPRSASTNPLAISATALAN